MSALSARFKLGARVFYLSYGSNVNGESHPCTACGQLHFSENWSQVAVPGTVTAVIWSEKATIEGVVSHWRYNIEADRDTRCSGAANIRESELYATLDEAHAARITKMNDAKKANEDERESNR